MHVSIIGPVYPYRGGIAHYNTSLIKRMSDTGHEIQVISFSRQYPRWLYPGKTDKDPSRNPVHLDASYILDPINPASWIKASNTIINFHPDAVIFQWWVTFWAPAYSVVTRLLREAGIPVIFIIHNVLPHETHIWDKPLARLALNYRDQFIVQNIREQLHLQELLAKCQVTICPHPEYDLFQNQRISKNNAKIKLGLDPEIPTILFFGIVRPYKGLKHLIQATAAVLSAGHQVKLLVVGEFWEDVAEYQSLIDQLGISKHVLLENHYIPDEEVGLYFSAADLLAAPYVHGTQSGVVRIATNYQLPLILSQAIADDDLISHYPHPIKVIRPEDQNQFFEAITNMLANDYDNSMEPDKPQHEIPDGWNNLIQTIDSFIQE